MAREHAPRLISATFVSAALVSRVRFLPSSALALPSHPAAFADPPRGAGAPAAGSFKGQMSADATRRGLGGVTVTVDPRRLRVRVREALSASHRLIQSKSSSINPTAGGNTRFPPHEADCVLFSF